MAVLEEDEIERRLAETGGWSRDGDAIRRRFKLEGFTGSMEFVNRVAAAAEEANHHPDITISWDTVDLVLSTHSEGGITENDFDLAAEIDSLA